MVNGFLVFKSIYVVRKISIWLKISFKAFKPLLQIKWIWQVRNISDSNLRKNALDLNYLCKR